MDMQNVQKKQKVKFDIFWSSPKTFGSVQNNFGPVKNKFGPVKNNFGHIGIRKTCSLNFEIEGPVVYL